MSRSRAARATHTAMSMHAVTVAGARSVTPHLRRITLAAPSLAEIEDDGPDQRFKLLLPRPHQDAPVVPDDPEAGWYAAWLAMPAAERPVLRTYTVRGLRRDVGELDVDIVLHEGADGPGSAWARTASPGDRVALYGSYAEHETETGSRQLLAGDHTALPAVAAILEQMDPAALGDVVLEVPGVEDRMGLTVPDGVELTWVDQHPGEPGAALADAVRHLPTERTWDYAWVCGEQQCAATLRRHLVRERAMPREQVMFMGYWRTGGAIDVDPADRAGFDEAVKEAEDAERIEVGG